MFGCKSSKLVNLKSGEAILKQKIIPVYFFTEPQ